MSASGDVPQVMGPDINAGPHQGGTASTFLSHSVDFASLSRVLERKMIFHYYYYHIITFPEMT